MKPVASSEQPDRQKGNAWVVDIIDLVVPGAPPVRHLVIVDASTRSPLLSEPVQNFAHVNAMLERTFKKLGVPTEITTDRALEFSDDGFQNLLASFRVHHVLSADTLTQGAVERLVRSQSKGKIT
jgi:hypothetical protein